MSRGILQFVHNNGTFDYNKLAIASLLHIKYYLKENVSLVTDESTFKQMQQNYSEHVDLYDQIIFDETPMENNSRLYNEERITFKNFNRLLAYDLSPYDETIVVDVDYLVQSDALKLVWDSPEPLRINRESVSVNNLTWTDDKFRGVGKQRISDTGIDFYWGTVFYFRKCDEMKAFFDHTKYVYDNWSFFQKVHFTHEPNIRVDHILSMSIHAFESNTLPIPGNSFVAPLPYDRLMDIHVKDKVLKVCANGALIISHAAGVQSLTKVQGLDIHIMNKESIENHFDKFVEIYG